MSAAYPRQIFIYETGAADAELQMLSRQKLADILAGRQALVLPQVQQTQTQTQAQQTVLIKFHTHKSDYNLN
jgi:hypothetical protein